MRTNGVQTLLMGGQACVFYGAAEFSRDTDLAVLCEADNLERLQSALDDLQARRIAVPPFESQYLQRGHAVHFRCAHPEAAALRVDVMSVMRGVDAFPLLQERRTTIESEGETIDLLCLPDLVQAKKTQRDKDWPMLRRLVEAHYFEFSPNPSAPQVEFWLRELRTPLLLREVASQHPSATQRLQDERPLLRALMQKTDEVLAAALHAEEQRERAEDREYWQPLKLELVQLRREIKSR
jgi:hypothetical protein